MSYANTILRINLTTRKWARQPLPEQFKRDYLGGRGFAVKWLYEFLPRGCDPLGPDNLLIFAVGPLNGTMAPSAARFSVACKSPLTGMLGLSNCGGLWSAELKQAGYDMIVVEGAASEMVYIEIDDDRVEIKPAEFLRGKGTRRTTDTIHDQLGDDFKVACIGQAGENGVLYAAIVTDYIDVAARTGVGAVMGSKNLKAIAVHGTQDVPLANADRFLYKMKDTHNKLKNDRLFADISAYGTTGLVNTYHNAGALAIRNNQTGVFNRVIGISRNTIDNIAKTPDRRLVSRPCSACIMPCKAVVEQGRTAKMGRPGHEAVGSLGARCGISNANTVYEANRLCEDYGLDVVSTGASIAFLMEAFQRRAFDEEVVEFGNDEQLLDLLHQIGERAGQTGDMLSKGVRNMTRILRGTGDYALHVKGLELPAIDGRAAKAMALSMAIGNRGGDYALHMPNFELLDKSKAEAENEFVFASTADPLDGFGKPGMVIWHEYAGAIMDSATMCKHYAFTAYALKPDDVAELLSFDIGQEISTMDLMMIGERISTVERMFNLRNGLKPLEDDTLPRRFLTEKLTEGKAAGQTVALQPMLQEYYMLRGFDERGLPRRENLLNLGLLSK